MQKVELILTIEDDANALMVMKYFKALQTFAQENFFNVTDFHCVKKFDENVVTCSFSHTGKREH
jgi:hypothetical protein